MHGESGTGRSQRHQQAPDDQQIDQGRPPGNQQNQRAREPEAGNDQPDDPRQPAPQRAVPGSRAGNQHTAQQKEPPRELTDRDRNRKPRSWPLPPAMRRLPTAAASSHHRVFETSDATHQTPARQELALVRCRCVTAGSWRILPERADAGFADKLPGTAAAGITQNT